MGFNLGFKGLKRFKSADTWQKNLLPRKQAYLLFFIVSTRAFNYTLKH